ncbi:bifunctional adenosylcobinamide kinase/adenosylcobinamide-phosphate guanylyltransferase [Alteribacter populi]|uniref:bifunctional adenosylcobinamide kinase/adenosylcobinamide-phosphate guanylyltransferase n=1 Tax=Alteribacter populi TaxID=2011011 RepID=UPI0012FDA1A8|nr:bifunctional adenosylcobinamide kinase/adenosylcobinamide-phosphate guanylyltransferase [Alteribacter populi]
MITFISGGARSGKSRLAEELAVSKLLVDKEPFYIATAKITDDEMKKRIQIHQQGRNEHWKTFEEPYFILSTLLKARSGDVVLLDCLTVWLSNMIFDLQEPIDRLVNKVSEWMKVAKEKQLQLIIVSNDVNEGLPHADPLVYQYVLLLESLHQFIVREADQAIQVVAGCPVYWKGEK